MNHNVVVITGASSGIGEATAYALAEQGCNLVLAARRKALLEDIASRCRERGVEVVVVRADVSSEDDVDKIAQAAVDAFGSFDIWINNAAVSMVGPFVDTTPEMFRKVIETNFFGYAYGAWAALRQFQVQGTGMIINISSVFGIASSPYESSYVASKFAVRGFSGALRQELHLMGLDGIKVCTVLPAAIDTPIYRNAANIMHKAVKPPHPMYPASKVASAIVNLIGNPQAEVIVGRAGVSMNILHRLLPVALFERLFGRFIHLTHFGHQAAEPTLGNLFEPGEYEGISGDWPKVSPQRKAAYAAIAVAAGAGLWWLWHTRGDGEGKE